MSDQEEEFEVEQVVGKCLDEEGRLLYWIIFQGYQQKEWLPMENLNCQELIDDFVSIELLVNRVFY